MHVDFHINIPARAVGYATALATLWADQASKLWILHGLQLPDRIRLEITPFLDFIMVWNRGISYGLFQQDTELGRWGLAAFTVAACLALAVWIWRAVPGPTLFGLGLVLGGAVGNGIDRVAYGAVVDFVSFHVGNFHWYVFNVADAAIVAGVALILYGAIFGEGKFDEEEE